MSGIDGGGCWRTGYTHCRIWQQSERRATPTPLFSQASFLVRFGGEDYILRALLSDAKILALDEATANVDRATDVLIQTSLQKWIAQEDKTLLIIAHRIDTVMNCDVLFVLEKGTLIEVGSPKELAGREQGHFKKMLQASSHVQ